MTECGRCKVETGTQRMSIFNVEMLCIPCKNKERDHPQYELAHEAERAACQRGDYNFPGIGLPKDLK